MTHSALYADLQTYIPAKKLWFIAKKWDGSGLFEPSHLWKWDGLSRPTEIGSDASEYQLKQLKSLPLVFHTAAPDALNVTHCCTCRMTQSSDLKMSASSSTKLATEPIHCGRYIFTTVSGGVAAPTRSSWSSNVDGWNLSASGCTRTGTDWRKTTASPPPRDGLPVPIGLTTWSAEKPDGAMSSSMDDGVSVVNHVSDSSNMSSWRSWIMSCSTAVLFTAERQFKQPILMLDWTADCGPGLYSTSPAINSSAATNDARLEPAGRGRYGDESVMRDHSSSVCSVYALSMI